MNPLVSICIPTYNGEEFLDECLQSCIGQYYNNYEIVICDDGSTDGTLGIIEKYLAVNPRMRLVKNAINMGLVANWNKCVHEAAGEWIKFVFQDDFISANCLREFVNAADANTRLVVSERNFILPEGASRQMNDYYNKEVRTLVNTGIGALRDYLQAPLSNIAVKNMCMNFIAEPSLSFFRKDVVIELGEFNPYLKQICDFEFMLRIASQYGLKYIPQKLCTFRIHANTTTNTNIANNYFTLRYIEPLLLAYFMLYSNVFSSLRGHLNFMSKAKLWLYFRVKAYQAYTVNKKEKGGHYLFEKGTGFKEITVVMKGSLLTRLAAAMLP